MMFDAPKVESGFRELETHELDVVVGGHKRTMTYTIWLSPNIMEVTEVMEELVNGEWMTVAILSRRTYYVDLNER